MNWLNNVFKSTYSNTNKQMSGTAGTNGVSIQPGVDSNGMPIYHEKQQKELCALHALNNLFQERFFTKTILDDLCVE